MINRLYISRAIFDEMISHCRENFLNEACGILAGKDEDVSKIYKMTNIEKSPVSYFMDSKEQFKVMKDIRENNLAMLAIFHSHPSSPAYPSAKDVSLAFYEDCIYVIVSLIEKEPVVKGFLIKEGNIKEIEIIIKGEASPIP
jgi:proteasome lid subunit RPN8/RPN11